MPEKQDYDEELVQLLARGELSDRQIAARVGLSPSQVGRIARGEKRPDLQPKILAAMRQNLKAAWKNGGRLDNETGEASPVTTVAGKTAKTAFDRHLAVELIAAGQFTLSQIADRLGIHKTAAWRIATGRSHPELQPLIREAQQHYRDRARRIGTKWAAQIVTKQIKVGLEDDGWVGLRARQDLLDRFLSPEDDSASQPDPADRPGLADLPEPLKTEVIRALGGPVDEDDPYGNASSPQPAPSEQQALPKEDVASRRTSGPSAEQEQRTPQPGAAALQKNDLASRRTSEPSAEQEETTPTEEGCSRNKQRRRRRRLRRRPQVPRGRTM